METNSIYERQCLDCNCNDCIFMDRDVARFQQSLAFHESLSLAAFERAKQAMRDNGEKARKKGDLEKFDYLHTEADNMRFQFSKKEVSINYGHCKNLDKPVQFIPNTLQLETQSCFRNRRDL